MKVVQTSKTIKPQTEIAPVCNLWLVSQLLVSDSHRICICYSCQDAIPECQIQIFSQRFHYNQHSRYVPMDDLERFQDIHTRVPHFLQSHNVFPMSLLA